MFRSLYIAKIVSFTILTVTLSCPSLLGEEIGSSSSAFVKRPTDELIKIVEKTDNAKELVSSLEILVSRGILGTKIITPFSIFLKSNPISVTTTGIVGNITEEKRIFEQEELVSRYKEWLSDKQNISYSPEANKIFYNILRSFAVDYQRWKLAKSDEHFPLLLKLLHHVTYKNIFLSIVAWENKDAQPTLLDKCMYYVSDFLNYPLAYVCPEMPVLKPATTSINTMRTTSGKIVKVIAEEQVVNRSNRLLSAFEDNANFIAKPPQQTVIPTKELTIEGFEKTIKKWQNWYGAQSMPEDTYYMKRPNNDIYDPENSFGIRRNYDLMKMGVVEDLKKYITYFEGSTEPSAANLVSEAKQLMNSVGNVIVPTSTSEIQTAKIINRPPYDPKTFSLANLSTPTEFNNIEKLNESKILLVEDGSPDRLMYSVIINKNFVPLGIQVDIAATSSEALSLAAKNHYDIIFTDKSMPDMDGHQLTRELRERGVNSLIFDLSAWGAQNPEELYRIGYDGYIEKPINLKEILLKTLKYFKGKEII